MITMNQTQSRPTPFTLLQRWRDLLVTRPAPAIWFDPRPNRRVRLNAYRRFDLQRPATASGRG